MSKPATLFVSAQLMLLVAAANSPLGSLWQGVVFHGVLASQYAMIGVWLGVGDKPLLQRLGVGAFGIGLLAAVSVTRTDFNAWNLLLACMRVVVCGVTFGLVRRKQKLVIRRTRKPIEVRFFQLSLSHFFGLTFFGAAFFAIHRLLESYGGLQLDMLLVLAVSVLGVAASLVSLAAAALVLGRSCARTTVATILIVLSVAGGLAWFAYLQTDSTVVAVQWFAAPALEAALVATSLHLVRLAGYGFARDTLSEL